MSKNTIVLRREGIQGVMSDQSIGTDALNAMSTIPGVANPEIVTESEDRVTLLYDWVGKEEFWETGRHLLKHGLARVDLD
jgi:hypothetical protein